MPLNRTVLTITAGVGFCLLAAQLAYTATANRSGPGSVTGTAYPLGNGVVATYAEHNAQGVPKSIGLAFTAGALTGLPTAVTDGNRCLDANSDGKIDDATECSHWHERVLPLPSEVTRRADMPFKWVLLNWNPNGHIPDGVYNVPHFDLHFYIEPIEKVFAIQRGSCGPEFVRCDQFERAKMPVPKNYMHADYKDVDAVAPAMGNHLIDTTSHEFHGHAFDHTFIYGAYEGRVTFYETMLTHKFLASQPGKCVPIKKVPAVAITGYYPTKTCYRYAKEKDEYTVSLEGFELRQASPPSHEPPSAGMPAGVTSASAASHRHQP